jgi:hypothetical protein
MPQIGLVSVFCPLTPTGAGEFVVHISASQVPSAVQKPTEVRAGERAKLFSFEDKNEKRRDADASP